MGALAKWGKMTELVATMGEDSVVADYCSRIAEGEHPRDISLSYGVSPIIMREWMESVPERMRKWELAKRCLADHLQWDSITEAQNCDVESVQLGKYRTETYLKAASVFNRKDYGAKVEVEINQQISITAALEEAHKRVINGVTYDQQQPTNLITDRQHEQHGGRSLVEHDAAMSEVCKD